MSSLSCWEAQCHAVPELQGMVSVQGGSVPVGLPRAWHCPGPRNLPPMNLMCLALAEAVLG